MKQALDQVEDILRRQRGVKYDEKDNFDLQTADRFIEQFDSITAMVGLVAIALSSVGLLVGGIGVMNIMLVSVTERTREIGLRMAVGARSRDILLQFLVEAILLCLAGGAVGILFGRGGSLMVKAFLHWPISVSIVAIVVAVVVCAVIGVAFGFYPAWKASRLDPIDALRYE